MSRDKHTEDFRGRDACDALVLGYFTFESTGLESTTLFLKVIPLVEYKRPPSKLTKYLKKQTVCKQC